MSDDTAQVIIDAAAGDQQAVELLAMLIRVAHAWDDVADGDKPLDAVELDAMFMFLLCELPANRFFVAHRETLHPLIVNAVTNWRTANAMEADERPMELEVAYIIRSAFVDLIPMVAYITQGHEAAIQIARRVRRLTHHEGLSGYLSNLGEQKSCA